MKDEERSYFNKKTPFNAAFNGLKIAFSTQKHVKLHLLSALWVCAAAYFLNVSLTEWAILILIISAVFGAEIMNTSVEALCDFIEPKFNSKIGIIKDLAAASVLCISLCAAIIGLIIFLPKIILLFV